LPFFSLETGPDVGRTLSFRPRGDLRASQCSMSDFALSTVIAAVASFVLAGIALALVRRFAAHLPQATRTARSLHLAPVPRVGGLAIWAGFLPVALLSPPSMTGGLAIWVVPWLAVTAISLADDWRGVYPTARLAVHALAAAVVAVAIFGFGAGVAATPERVFEVTAATLVIVWSANLFNFMDGSDGLAASMGVSGFGAYAVAAAVAGTPAQAYVALAVAAAAFLAINVPPARAFMGDVGSVPLGFLAAVFGIAGWRAGTWPGWFPLLVFLPFISDASLTLGTRALRGEKFWLAHKTHYYQRLHQLGAGHRGTLLGFAAVMAGVAATALTMLVVRPERGWWALAAWVVVVAALFLRIDYHWNRKRPAS
jgi:UDP-GlcNAc:undecaprenyl-phosphate/decaprenyl-phosphate GlcNAc-1-phosphate transferase